MVVDEAHLIAIAGESANAVSEGGDKIVQIIVQYVGQDGAFQVSPQAFNQVQAGAIGRQPVHGDLIAMLVEPMSTVPAWN